MPSLDSLNTLKPLKVGAQTYHYFSLTEAARQLGDLQRLPMSLKVLLENLLRWEDGHTVTGDDLRAGTLVEVLHGYRPPADPIRIVYPSKRHLSPRVRGFIDLLVASWEPGVPWEY